MTATKIDLIESNAIEVGATYEQTFRICGKSLIDYVGYCEFRTVGTASTLIATPFVTVLSSDVFKLTLSAATTATISPGTYLYDVKFVGLTETFFAVRGNVEVIETYTEMT